MPPWHHSPVGNSHRAQGKTVFLVVKCRDFAPQCPFSTSKWVHLGESWMLPMPERMTLYSVIPKWGISGVDSSCSRVAQCKENLSLALEILGWAQWLQGSSRVRASSWKGGLSRPNWTRKLGVTGICYIGCEIVICRYSLSFQGTRLLPLWDGKHWIK